MIVRNKKDLDDFIARALKIDLSRRPWRITAEPYEPNRSAEQNRLAFMWYAEIGKGTGEGKDYTRNFCKWHYGCSILAEQDPKFNEVYVGLMDRYEYEQCIDMMENLEVTRLMNVKQMAEYLKHIELYAAEKQVSITKPIDAYTLAMGKEYEQKHDT